MGPRNSSADERKRRAVECRNGVQSGTISYSNVVIPEGGGGDNQIGKGHQELIQQGSAKLKKSAGKLGTIICQMTLFDWLIMLVRLKVMF